MRPANRRPVTVLAFAVLAGAAVATLAPAARAGETRGPQFGTNRYTAAIRHLPGESDFDDYVSPLARGERLAVQVTRAGGSRLLPSIELIGPDGGVRDVRVLRRAGAAEVRRFAVDATGDWTVRIAGDAGSEGAYAVAFRTLPAPEKVLRGRRLAGDPPVLSVPFDAVSGSVADLRVTWTGRGGRIVVAALRDPFGNDLLAAAGAGAVRTTAQSAEIRGFRLAAGHGTYSLDLAASGPSAPAFDVRARVRPPKRPVGTKPRKLSGGEPCLEIRGTPIEGVARRQVRLTGSALGPGVVVYFGGVAAPQGVCYPGDLAMDVVPPPGTPGAVVDVAAVQPDGQACVRAGYFRYVPPPQVDGFEDLSGAEVEGWSAAGGLALRIRGRDFRAADRVRFPGGVEVQPASFSETELTAVAPAGKAATDHLVVVDEFDQVGRSQRSFEMKNPPAFAAQPYAPQVVAADTATEVVVTGTSFDVADVLLFDGAVVLSSMSGAGRRKFTVPKLAPGFRTVRLRDRLGVVADGPDLQVKSAPVVSGVVPEDGPVVGANGVPAEGGTTLRVDGDQFAPSDVVKLGGVAVTRLAGATSTSFRFVAPPGALGDAALEVADVLGRSATYDAAVRYVGFADATAARLPQPGATDDFRGAALVSGDLDGDGDPDVVLGAASGVGVGDRTELTRVLLNDGAGAFEDATAWTLPSAGSDATGGDDWNASALALGDLDLDGDLDLVAAGASPDASVGSDVRLFANDGSGGFALDEGALPSPTAHSAIYAYNEWWSYYAVVGARDPRGTATGVALGDLDLDGDLDLVAGRDDFEQELEIVEAKFVDFTLSPPFVSYLDVQYHTINRLRYFPAPRVWRNDLDDGGRFADVSADWLPPAGTSAAPAPASFVARDLALADLDGDGDLDLVVAWDDPTTVSVSGLRNGTGTDSARVATRVLRNDGDAFTDATAGWMPAGASSEWWQADRIALADLDDDGDPDLVLACGDGLDGWKGGTSRSARALRVLRNDGSAFTDVSASALPAPAGDDDLRGRALAVRDVDGDGVPDLVIGTAESLSGPGGAARRSTRLLRGAPGLTFTDWSALLPSPADESGEADALLLGDLDGSGGLSLLLVGEDAPGASEGGAVLRALDWSR